MASWGENKRPKSPRSPSECDFSDVFFERNSDPQIKVCEENNTETQEKLTKEKCETPHETTREDRTPECAQIPDKSEDSGASSTALVEGELVDAGDNLIDAIKQDRLDAVKKLLSEGCDPNEPVDLECNRPLHWAVYSQKPEYVRLLLEAGVDVNLPGKRNCTPLMVTPSLYRSDNAPWSIIHDIIQADCDINRVGSNSKSALHMAVQLGNVNLVKVLLQYNVDTDIRDSKGRSPIMYAGLLSGANILQYTTEYTFKDVEQIAYLLIKANANVFHHDKFRQNALYLTIPNIELCDRNRVQQVSPCIIQMLELAGTKIPPKRFLRRWDSVSRNTSQEVQIMIRWFDKQRKVVKPLHHGCRLVIRRCIGQRLEDKLLQITLPDKIRDYLMLPELDDIMKRLSVSKC